MYRLVNKADGSFQIVDDTGENFGIFGGRDEALEVMDFLNTKEKFPNIKPTPPKVPEPVKPKPIPHRTVTKAKPAVVKRSPIKAKRGRPPKKR